MANRRLPARKIKEILRLKHACGLSKREIARRCNVARSTVADYLMRARAGGQSWPESAELSETELEAHLFPTEHLPNSVHRPPPDCEYTYNQLCCYRNVNLTPTQYGVAENAEKTEKREAETPLARNLEWRCLTCGTTAPSTPTRAWSQRPMALAALQGPSESAESLSRLGNSYLLRCLNSVSYL